MVPRYPDLGFLSTVSYIGIREAQPVRRQRGASAKPTPTTTKGAGSHPGRVGGRARQTTIIRQQVRVWGTIPVVRRNYQRLQGPRPRTQGAS